MTFWSYRSGWFIGILVGAAVFTGMAQAQAEDMRGGVTYAGGQVIPAGRIEITIEDAEGGNVRLQGDEALTIESDGKSRQIEFPLTWPGRATGTPKLRLVAHLRREDGWLLARGSAGVKVGQPVSVTLNTVMY
ncbi:hypothetical protein [Tateyamaria sp. syn59]|uniref:hypothetical protein n=1 Tax=Tateyamaria sp. syn59 TaxID=2576942 RepID=UPI001673F9A6|nr:hypothetical protein [Tateyamaria sp. syn59]